MKFLGFDLAALFKAPVVTEVPVIPEPQEPMPVEYNETDTNCVMTDLWDDTTGPQEPQECEIHQQMYEASCPPACTVKRDEIENPWTLGASENFQGGSEEIHK